MQESMMMFVTNRAHNILVTFAIIMNGTKAFPAKFAFFHDILFGFNR